MTALLHSDPTTVRVRALERVTTVGTVVALSTIGAAIHLYVAPEHLAEWWAYGWFFLLLAAGQLATVPLVLRWRRPALLSMAIAVNVGAVLVWLVSRTSGLPIGPPVLDMTGGLADPTKGGYGAHALGVPEPVGVLDVTATVCELLVVLALCALLPATWRRWAVNTVLVVGLSMWCLFILGVL